MSDLDVNGDALTHLQALIDGLRQRDTEIELLREALATTSRHLYDVRIERDSLKALVSMEMAGKR